MARIKEDKKRTTSADKEHLRKLEEECTWLYELLADDPGNQLLNKRLKELEIDMCRISGEKTMEY